MKTRITLALIFTFLLSGMFAQINNWDSVTYDGFGAGKNAFQIIEHNNALYVGTEQMVAGVSNDIYASGTGDMGTWSPTSFTLTASAFEQKINCFYSDKSTGGKLYAGTYNSEDGGSIYSFDGFAWLQISGSTPPWDSTYDRISSIVITSQDTIFAFLLDYYNYNSQIWKTHKTNISWTMANELPLGSSSVGPATLYNDTIFFTLTDYNTGRSFVYKTTTGVDTVKAHPNPGLTSSNNEFMSFGIHNDALYTGTGNYTTGACLYSYTSNSGWTVIDTSGLGYGFDLFNIYSIHSYRHKLWLSGTGQDGSFIQNGARMNSGPNHTLGGPITAEIFVSSDGKNFRQTAPSGFRDYYFYGDYCRLASMGDYIYAAGTNSSGPTGEVWRSSVPLADFTTDFDTTCAQMQENYYDASVNAPAIQWYVNTTAWSTNSTTNYIYPVAGTYTISLVAYSADGLYSDSVSILKDVTNMLDANPLGNFNVCQNSEIQLASAFNISGGTTPYNYYWDNSVNNYTSANPTVIADANSTYTLSLTDMHSCAVTRTVSVNVTTSTDLSGTITDASAGFIDDGIVYAFKYQPGTAGLDTVAFVTLQSGTGSYLFTALDSGDYMVKVLPNETTFPLAVPTYYGNVFQWDSSIVVSHGCAQNDIADIQIVETSVATGPGSISGYIIEGPGYGQGLRLFGDGGINVPFVPGGPLKGIDVKLGKNPGGGIQARIMSDSTGYYEFNNLPLEGYRIYVDIPNLPMDSTREVTLGTGSENSVQNNYFADSMWIYVDTTQIIGLVNTNKIYENNFAVYPNPAKGMFSLTYDLEKVSAVSFEITNTLGEVVYLEKARNYQAGQNTFLFNTYQLQLNGGIYFISMTYEGKKYSQRLVVLD